MFEQTTDWSDTRCNNQLWLRRRTSAGSKRMVMARVHLEEALGGNTFISNRIFIILTPATLIMAFQVFSSL